MIGKRNVANLEILGTALCLDFANTVNSRHHIEHDYLGSYADLADWCQRAGILSAHANRDLQAATQTRARSAAQTLRQAVQLREVIFRVYSSLAGGKPPDTADSTELKEFYGRAVSESEFRKQGARYDLAWEHGVPESVLHPIAFSAGQLLLSEDLHRLRECPGCGWLFLDQSKNQTRRWCNMDTCGARDKMRRYYRRNKNN